MQITLKLPIHWDVWSIRKPKVEFLGLNFYRNAHFQVLSKVKKDYTSKLLELKWKRIKSPISITYIFHPSRRWQDMMNAIAIADKFLQDSLVTYWVIDDDNYDNVKLITSIVWEKVKDWYIEAIIDKI